MVSFGRAFAAVGEGGRKDWISRTLGADEADIGGPSVRAPGGSTGRPTTDGQRLEEGRRSAPAPPQAPTPRLTRPAWEASTPNPAAF